MSEGVDLATLSIRIDSSDAKAGVESLTKLSGAAEKTETATKKVETATEQYLKGLERMVREVEETNRALERMRTVSKDLELVTAAAGGLQAALGDTAGLQRFNTQLGASDVAMERFQKSLMDTAAVGRFMGDLERASLKLRDMHAAQEKAAAAVRDVQQVTEAAEPPVTRLARGLGGLVSQFVGVAAAGAALRSATTEALGFGTAMAQVSTLLDGEQLKMMGTLAERAKALGAEFGRMPTDQAKALYDIMSAGASDAAQATEMLRVANQLAIGGVTDVGTAADGLTSIMATYGSSLRSATEAADAMFVSAADGKTSIEAIARHIGKVAPIASQTGVSLQELLAANAALTKSGIKTETAMEGVRSILAQVAKPSEDAAKLARALGVDFTTAGLRARGFAGFMEHVRERTHGNTEQLAVLVGGVEALLPAMALTGTAAADFAASLEHMKDSAGRTEVAFNKMAETPQFKLDQLRARFASLQVDVGDGLLSAMGPSMDGLLRHFNEVTTAARYLGEGLAVLATVRAAGWAQDWTKALADKAGAARQARDAMTNAALADAAYSRRVTESRAAALRNALAMLQQRQAALETAAALEGPFTVAHTRAAIASNALAQAKVKEALAIEGASFAARAGSAALSALGGPIGIITTALGLAASAYFEFGRAAEEASEKAKQAIRESGAAADRASQIITDLQARLKVEKDLTKQQEAYNLARLEFINLGPKYEKALSAGTGTMEGLRADFERMVKADLVDARLEQERLKKYWANMEKAISVDAKGDTLHQTREEIVGTKKYKMRSEKDLKPIEEELRAQREREVQLLKAQQRLDDAAKASNTLTAEEEKRAAATTKVNAATSQSAQSLLDDVKAKEAAEKKATAWLARLEEEARALGKTKGEALELSDEYAALTAEQKRQADVAIAKIKAAEEAKAAEKAAAKAEEERTRILQELNRELGNPGAEKYAQAQRILREELDQGRVSLSAYQAQMAKARSLWTEEGKAEAQLAKELEQLERQLNPLLEAQKRMDMVNRLFNEGRLGAVAYRKEVERLQEQLSTGFALAKDSMVAATQHMEDAFVTFATTGKLEFGTMVDGILKDIARLMAQRAFVALLDSATSALAGAWGSGGGAVVGGADLSGMFGAMVGGARAAGGPVRAGHAHVVGELGPELFVPSSSGTIVPNKALGGGDVHMSVQVVVNADGSSSVDVQSQGGREDAQRMGRHLADTIRKVVGEELQPGGSIYNFTWRRR
ncbi:phage tail tape measure protein [Pyxidicoccus caerfyrddinensis]|uniref:phage tail tape measure protein n=1 Tax=Pyxidicoccus caerfyrddinensis TaxID=2709663 RepID=UPI0013DCE77F|nr:phage tail tape measure protein [Pyxidicoccus caerfyrddinensis]